MISSQFSAETIDVYGITATDFVYDDETDAYAFFGQDIKVDLTVAPDVVGGFEDVNLFEALSDQLP